MYKLRTLRPDAEQRLRGLQDVELDQLTEASTRASGGVLRATQLDELPQLLNVLRGDMSIVGPRPIRPVFFEELVVDIPQYWQRLVVRPGLTGFAQLRMRRDTTWAEKLAHDLEYLADRSARLYLRIVLTCPPDAAAGADARPRSRARVSRRADAACAGSAGSPRSTAGRSTRRRWRR